MPSVCLNSSTAYPLNEMKQNINSWLFKRYDNDQSSTRAELNWFSLYKSQAVDSWLNKPVSMLLSNIGFIRDWNRIYLFVEIHFDQRILINMSFLPVLRELFFDTMILVEYVALGLICQFTAHDRMCREACTASFLVMRAAPKCFIFSGIMLEVHIFVISSSWVTVCIFEQLHSIPIAFQRS